MIDWSSIPNGGFTCYKDPMDEIYTLSESIIFIILLTISVFQLITRLRQMCNHSLLLPRLSQEAEEEAQVLDLQSLIDKYHGNGDGKFATEFVEQLNGSGDQECPVEFP